jgi:hypothetical protein
MPDSLTPLRFCLIAYKFPPYDKVGARRWAKFCKYLAIEGAEIHVISNRWDEKHGNGWLGDVTKLNIIIKRFPWPIDWLLPPSDKILFRFWMILSRLLGWTDEAHGYFLFNQYRIKRYLKKHQIKLLVATGPPFSANYFAARIKKRLPFLRIVQDLRDLWTEEFKFEYPHIPLGSRLHRKMISMEKYSLRSADLVVSVCPACVEKIKRTAQEYNAVAPIVEIANGFDADDYKSFDVSEFPETEFSRSNLNISYFGTLDSGRDKEFLKFLRGYGSQELDWGSSVLFHFFGHVNPDFLKIIQAEKFDQFIRIWPFQSPSRLQKYMFFSDMHLVVNDAVYYYAYGSKFYDALLYRKPIVLISRPESLTQLIVSNGLGIATDNSLEGNAELSKQLNDFRVEKFLTNPDYDYENHSIKKLTARYKNVLEILLTNKLNPKFA